MRLNKKKEFKFFFWTSCATVTAYNIHVTVRLDLLFQQIIKRLTIFNIHLPPIHTDRSKIECTLRITVLFIAETSRS